MTTVSPSFSTQLDAGLEEVTRALLTVIDASIWSAPMETGAELHGALLALLDAVRAVQARYAQHDEGH